MPTPDDRSHDPGQPSDPSRNPSTRRRPRPSIEERVAAVSALRGRTDAEARHALLAALEDRSSLVVASTADVIAADERAGFAAVLAAAFHRFLPDAIRRDSGCRAKTAIVRALLATGKDEPNVYLAGMRHVQAEPVWGGREDTAVELCAQSLAGLVRARHPSAAVYVATLLADPEWGARVGAAEAAVELEAAVAVPLLRFKVLVGDAQPEVIGACWASLLQLAPDESVPAAAEALGARSDAESDAIALALGGSRLEARGGARAARRVERARVALVASSRVCRDHAPAERPRLRPPA